MVTVFKRPAFFLTFLCLSLTSEIACSKESINDTISLQDSKAAVHFFKDELNFKTNPYGIKRLIDSKAENITIVDVRSANDYAQGHIPGAINIPYEKYNSFQGEGAEKEFPGLRKDGYNYVYCYELLCDLAKVAAIKFASLGYPVKEMNGGFDAWKEKAYPIEK